jgi:hypothetical protein
LLKNLEVADFQAQRRGGASRCRPIDFVKGDWKRSFLEQTRKFIPKFVHILAELHNRYDLIDLTSHLVLPVFLQPLMWFYRNIRSMDNWTQFSTRLRRPAMSLWFQGARGGLASMRLAFH